MGKRRAGKGGSAGGRSGDLPDYYAKSDSDVSYARKAQQRARQRGLKTWLTRLVVVLILAAAWHFWGPQVVRQITGGGEKVASDFQGVGHNLQEGRDRRSGVGLDENP